ncbi:MAG TPA: type IV pilus biogenesis/stability protein PilW [Burkholderiaceae bacterium]|nr:type IV pilus biogenesis/stability protein PilW [Burkholderiaceae bacterium]
MTAATQRADLGLGVRPALCAGRLCKALGLGLLFAAAMLLDACKTTTTVNGVQVSKDVPVPGATEADAKKRAAVRLQLAATYYQSGQLQTAMETVRHAIELDPTSAEAYGLLGLIQMDAGQVVQASANFQKALSIDRNNPELNNNYGWFLCQTGHERDSITYFERAVSVRLYQSPARALQNAGICLLRIHDDAAAEQYFLRALAADATTPVAKFQLAQLYLREQRFDRCDFYFDLLLKSAEPNAETLWLGARIAHAKKDDVTERHYAEQLQLRFPDSPQAAAMHRGHYDE